MAPQTKCCNCGIVSPADGTFASRSPMTETSAHPAAREAARTIYVWCTSGRGCDGASRDLESLGATNLNGVGSAKL
jgi:hypothetical protein